MGAAPDASRTGGVVDGARVYTVAGYRVAFGIAALAVGCAAWLHVRKTHAAVTKPSPRG